uniref:Uncharacterized protein n=1 Tax=Solanum lycopersicum TaxID=4081 RepID=A0A3Q7FKC9_SOLLC
GDSSEIQCRSNFLFNGVSGAVRGRLGGRGTTTTPLYLRNHTSLISSLRFGLNWKINRAPNNASSKTKNYNITTSIQGHWIRAFLEGPPQLHSSLESIQPLLVYGHLSLSTCLGSASMGK